MTKINEDMLILDDTPMRFPDNYIAEFIYTRVNDPKFNKNFMSVALGGTGSGKTYSQLRLAELLDPEFNIDRVVFSVKEFMDLVNSGKLHRGSVIVSEELGTQMSRREWYAVSNRLFSFILQTFRNLNLIVLFTVPNADFIDSHAMKLFHMAFETLGIDTDRNLVYIRPKLIKTNVLGGGKHYFKFLRLVDKGRVDVVDSLGLKKPSKKLCEEYEKKKTIFTEQLNRRVLAEVSKVEDEIKEDLMDEMANEHKEVLKAYTKGYSHEQIAEATGLSMTKIRNILTTLRKKGLMKNIKTGEITMKLPSEI